MMAERPTGSHPYPLTSQQSAPGILPSQQQAQQMQQQLIPPAVKDINAVNVCRVGQETVHDIVSKAQEIFQILSPKNLQV